MNKGFLRSVGIDIGTTTTHLVFSKLIIANTSAATRIPKLEIRGREVTYSSQIHFTPLNNDRSIDADGVFQILNEEYNRAGVCASEIDCGAVIITGETALLRNAPEVLSKVSTLAGDFVSASAGPNLESILAARGSGAVEASRSGFKTIMNVDIGGGTTNAAVFRNGELIDAACLRLGGRCARLDSDGVVTSITEGAKKLLGIEAGDLKGTLSPLAEVGATMGALNPLAEVGASLITTSPRNPSKDLVSLGRRIASAIVDFISCSDSIGRLSELLMTEAPRLDYKIDEYWFSGGVAAFVDGACDDKLAYGDIGPFVAEGLKEVLSERDLNYKIPASPIQATVIGASSHSVQLSGNTITIAPESLPLKNVPLLRPFKSLKNEEISADEAAKLLTSSLLHFDLSAHCGPVALVIDEIRNPRYALLEQWSDCVSSALTENLKPPYVVIVSTDAAMALGQLMRKHINAKDLIVIDGLDCSTGDFIEIGRPIGNGLALPVTVKTLLFDSSIEERI